jgi:hypothetical protein
MESQLSPKDVSKTSSSEELEAALQELTDLSFEEVEDSESQEFEAGCLSCS